MNIFSKNAPLTWLTALCWLIAGTTAFAQSYKGFNVGRYQGSVTNKTGGNTGTGKGALDIRSISSAGAVQAYLLDSDGLEGAGLLTGSINANGVMQLAGVMTSPSDNSRWQSALIAVILPTGELRMGNQITLNGTVQKETAVMTFANATAVANATASRPAQTLTGVGATYGARNPHTTNVETKYTRGTGLMTKEEIIDYMRANGYANGKPKIDPQVCKDLIEEIKRRGVKEPFQPNDDVSSFRENGCSYYIEDAAQHNVGTPTTINWLSGTWLLVKIGGTVDTRPGDGYIYRQNEMMAKTGFITINANGTYIWKVNPSDSPDKYINGTWRKAMAEEMKQQGGAGIVLQKGNEAADWIVFKYSDNIEVEHLQQRGWNRVIGTRK